MTDDTLEPLFAHDEPGPRYKATDIATAIARGGVPHQTAFGRIQNYTKARQIHTRGKGPAKNSANLYSISDMGAAVMLSNFQDFGIADQHMLMLASTTLYSWNSGQKARSAHPITAAISDTWEGNPWGLHLRTMRNLQSGQLLVNRAFDDMRQEELIWSNPAANADPLKWRAVGDILISTDGLTPLQRLFETPDGAN